MGTNVKPADLNYDHYETKQYDNDIVRSIPGHRELHKKIEAFLKAGNLSKSSKILELGVGTGLTSSVVLNRLPGAEYAGIDFSRNMLVGAGVRLEKYRPKLICADYAKSNWPEKNGLVISVIGIHHQKTDKDKKRLFGKIYSSLSPSGFFIFGDLVTYEDKHTAALNEALHFHYLVDHAANKKSLAEWAYHHKFLNSLAPLEKQTRWLQDCGFQKVRLLYRKYNTALVIAQK